MSVFSSPVLNASTLANFEQWLSSVQSGGTPDQQAFQNWFEANPNFNQTTILSPDESAALAESQLPTWSEFIGYLGDSVIQAAGAGFQIAKTVARAGAQQIASIEQAAANGLAQIASAAIHPLANAANNILKTALVGTAGFVTGELLALGFLGFIAWLVFFPHAQPQSPRSFSSKARRQKNLKSK